MKKKIVFIDCDNTLATATEKGEEYIPESAIAAIKKARENGVLVYLCTGRSLAEMDGPVSEVTFDGVIGGSGAFVMENNTMVYHCVMNAEDVALVVNMLNGIDAMYMLEGNGGIYANRKMKDIYMEDERNRRFGEIMQAIDDADYSDINKIVYISFDLTIDEVNEKLNNRYDIVGLSYENNGYGGEISTRDVSKGSAVRFVLNRLNIKKEESCSVGDSYNDVSMFKETAVSVAMGNAVEGLDEMTDFKSTDIDDDGLYNAFKYCEII